MTKTPKFCSTLVLSLGFLLCFPTSSFSSWPDFSLSPECFSGWAYGSQLAPSLARGETNLLAVWEDERITTEKDIFCTRLTYDWEILDPVGIPVCLASGWQTAPVVAAGGEIYLVVWQDYRAETYDIYGARIDADGNVLDPDGFPICMGGWWAETPHVAWDGENFLVVWSDDRDMISLDVYGTRVTPDGAVLDGSGFRISSETLRELTPRATYNGSNYLVVWEVEGG
jgi:hypothetical protein